MAWTAPRTWRDDEVWTAAAMNLHLRDNLLETMPAKTTAASTWLVADANNNLAERNPGAGTYSGSSFTISASAWEDNVRQGPSITRTCGPRVLVIWSAHFVLDTDAQTVGLSSITITKAPEAGEDDELEEGDAEEVFEASDEHAIIKGPATRNNMQFQGSHHVMIHNLVEDGETGEFTFTQRFRKSGTGNITTHRHSIFVWPMS